MEHDSPRNLLAYGASDRLRHCLGSWRILDKLQGGPLCALVLACRHVKKLGGSTHPPLLPKRTLQQPGCSRAERFGVSQVASGRAEQTCSRRLVDGLCTRGSSSNTEAREAALDFWGFHNCWWAFKIQNQNRRMDGSTFRRLVVQPSNRAREACLSQRNMMCTRIE